MGLIIIILPVVTKDLPISPRFTPYNFLSRCKFSTLTTRQPMVEFYSLTFPRFPLRKKEHNSYFGKNRTHDFRTSRCAGYLLDHSGDKRSIYLSIYLSTLSPSNPVLSLLHCTALHCTLKISEQDPLWQPPAADPDERPRPQCGTFTNFGCSRYNFKNSLILREGETVLTISVPRTLIDS